MHEVSVVNVVLFLVASGLLAGVFLAFGLWVTPVFRLFYSSGHRSPRTPRRARRKRAFEDRETRVWSLGGKQ